MKVVLCCCFFKSFIVTISYTTSKSSTKIDIISNIQAGLMRVRNKLSEVCWPGLK